MLLQDAIISQKREYDIDEKKLSAVKAGTKKRNSLRNKEIFDMVYGELPDKRKLEGVTAWNFVRYYFNVYFMLKRTVISLSAHSPGSRIH